MKKTVSGFTIVELLIVIVVIGILAAITIVAYNGIQSRAHDAAIRSDFHNIVTKLEMYRVDNGFYPYDPAGFPGSSCDQASGDVIQPELASIDMKLSKGSYNTSTANTNLLYLASDDGQHYALLGYAVGNPTYYITDQSQAPNVYTPDPSVGQSNYPGGTPCGVADHLNISSSSTNADFAFYYIYTQSAGGFRIW